MSQFTIEQQQAINARDTSLVLSAGAGAGKTTTLIERIYSRITDPIDPVSIDSLLILTFTRAAAGDMKAALLRRLQRALEDEKIDPASREIIERQLIQVSCASISTIHSFCLDLISIYGDRINLAPGFRLLSEEEFLLIRRDFNATQIEDILSSDAAITKVLEKLLQYFDAVKGPHQLQTEIARLQNFLSAISDFEAFDAQMQARLDIEKVLTEVGTIQTKNVEEFVTWIDKLVSFCNVCVTKKPNSLMTFITNVLLPMKNSIQAADPDLRMQLTITELDSLLQGSEAFPRFSSSAEIKATSGYEDFKKLASGIKSSLTNFLRTLQSVSEARAREEHQMLSEVLLPFIRECGIRWTSILNEKLIADRTLTFELLERLAIKILRENPDVVAELHDRFREVYVDEFQDDSRLQDEIIGYLCRDRHDPELSNLILVGDIKQSIYGFRNADPKVFIEHFNASTAYRLDSSSRKQRLSLTRNFRSEPELLEEFNLLFERLFHPDITGISYDAEHAFIPGRAKSEQAQAKFHFDFIESARAKQDQDSEGADEEDATEPVSEIQHVVDIVRQIGEPYSGITILLRSAKSVIREYLAAFRDAGIPVESRVRLSFLDAPEIIDFLSLIRCIDNPYDEIHLLAVLRSPVFGWTPTELLTLRQLEPKGLFFDILRSQAAKEPSIAAKAEHFLTRHAKWQREAAYSNVRDLFQSLIDELDLLDAAMLRQGGTQCSENLLALMEKAALFDSFERKGLTNFLDFLGELSSAAVNIEIEPEIPSNSNAVKIMTVHNSKGLEFDHVIIPSLGRNINQMDLKESFLYSQGGGIAWKFDWSSSKDANANPPLYSHVYRELKTKNIAEEIRLFYVAVTRAKQSVYFVGSVKGLIKAWNESADESSPLPAEKLLTARTRCHWLLPILGARFSLIAEDSPLPQSFTEGITQVRLLPSEQSVVESDDLLDVMVEATDILDATADREARVNSSAIRAKLSVTEVKRLYEANRDPDTPPFKPYTGPKRDNSQSLEIGNLTHRILAKMDFDRFLREGNLLGEFDRLHSEGIISDQQLSLIPRDQISWFLGTALGKRMRREGAKLHRERAFTVGLPVAEYFPKHRQHDGDTVILQGQLDVLFEEDGNWIIVDYKTDRCANDPERLAQLVRAYNLQLQLYRLLVQRTLGPSQPITEVYLVFLDARQIEAVPPIEISELNWEQVMDIAAVLPPEVREGPREVVHRGV